MKLFYEYLESKKGNYLDEIGFFISWHPYANTFFLVE